MEADSVSANVAQREVLSATERKHDALRKLEDESIRVRESIAKFYSTLALFSGGTIALSVTYLGYLKNIPNRSILYPKALIMAWIALMACVVASLFSVLARSYYVHFSRLRMYLERLIEEKETFVEEMGKLYIVNVTSPEEKQQLKERLITGVGARTNDRNWARRREAIAYALSVGLEWFAALAFPTGLGLLTFFAIKNM